MPNTGIKISPADVTMIEGLDDATKAMTPEARQKMGRKMLNVSRHMILDDRRAYFLAGTYLIAQAKLDGAA